MFGYYDPETLDVQERTAEIDFIEAASGETRRVSISGSSHARQIAHSMGDQCVHKIAAMAGPMRAVRGSMVFLPGDPDSGLIAPEGGSGKPVPLRLAFDVSHGDLPSSGYAIVQGAETDGAILVNRIAIKAAPSPDPALRAAVSGALSA